MCAAANTIYHLVGSGRCHSRVISPNGSAHTFSMRFRPETSLQGLYINYVRRGKDRKKFLFATYNKGLLYFIPLFNTNMQLWYKYSFTIQFVIHYSDFLNRNAISDISIFILKRSVVSSKNHLKKPLSWLSFLVLYYGSSSHY